MKKENSFKVKRWKRKSAFFLAWLFFLTSIPLPESADVGLLGSIIDGAKKVQEFVGSRVIGVYANDDKDYFLTADGYEINLSGNSSEKEIDLTETNRITLSLKSKKKGEATGSFSAVGEAVIKFTDAGKNVCTAKAENNVTGTATSSITLERVGRGSEQVVGTIQIPGSSLTYNFNFLVKADVKIKKSPLVAIGSKNKIGYIHNLFTNDGDDVKSLFIPLVNTKHQVEIDGYNEVHLGSNLKNYKGHFEWILTSESGNVANIVEVDGEKGELKALGAGYADLEVRPVNNAGKKAKPDKARILIPLRLSETNITGGNFETFHSIENDKVLMPNSGDTAKLIYTNALDPKDIEWEVKQEGKDVTKDGKKISDFVTITNGSNQTDSSASSVTIDVKRAGSYTITAKLKNLKGDFITLPTSYVRFKYNVPMITQNLTKYLNVGDTFNIYNNSNIGSISGYQFTVLDGRDVISIDKTSSEIKALKTGEAVIKVTGPVVGESFTITLFVMDTLTLNQSNATIPIGGKLDLAAMSTDVSTADSWEWSSDTNRVATVEGSGNSAVVKGIAPGSAVITVQHITKGGITKKATCKVEVTAGVTGIKLVPTEEIVDVGKVVSIRAEVEPKTSQTVRLYWRSSNPKIVEVDNIEEHSAVNSVTAKAPGTAVIMALNKDNVVLGSCTITVKTAVTGIKISEKAIEKTLEDKTHQLTAITTPENATVTALKWKSTNPEVATVDEKTGLVTFKKPGRTTIICVSESNPSVMDTCEVNVAKGIASLKVDKNEVSLAVGETYQLNAVISPEDASNKNLIFTSLDSKVATVSNTGLITGKASGMAYITISTVDKKFNASCTVKVSQKPTGFKLNASALVLDIGEGYTLEGTFNPKTTTEKKITWTSSDNSIAKVDAKGRVIGVGVGKCIINATTSNSLNAVCYVTVNKPVSSISISEEEVTLAVGDEQELEVVFDSDEVTNKDVKWKSSDTSVVTVDKKGVIKGIAGGIAVITVTSEENGMSAISIVTVEEPVAEITLNKTSLNLGYHQKFTLVATIKNNSATRKKIKWSSSKKSVVTVGKNGVIYGKKLGYATIKAAATDGSGAEATCRVRVVRAATSLSISDSFLNMVVGKTRRLKVKISPKNATYKTAKFKSDNTDVAIVDNKGKITAIGAGRAKITAYTKDNSGKKQVCIVQVRDYVPSGGITLSATNLTMGVGDKQSVIYSLAPNGSDDKVTWASNNKAAVRVSKKGVITGIAPGSSAVTATTSSGKNATVSVTVVGLNFNRLELEQYDSYTLSVLGDVKNITWDSSNPSIATVSGGTVVGKKEGSCDIYARVNGALLTCKVRVKKIR